jgi:hypothetical protein
MCVENLLQTNQQTILGKLFEFLNRNKIEFSVLGNSTTYPEIYSGDIDLAVYQHDFDRMADVLLTFCQETGCQLVQKLQHEKTACAYVSAHLGSGCSPQLLMVDICSDYYRNGQKLLDAKELLLGRISEKGGVFSVPPPSVGFIYYLLKKLKNRILPNGTPAI